MSVFVRLQQRLSPGLYRTRHRRRAATADSSQIRNVLLNGGNPRWASPKSVPRARWYGSCFKAIQYAWLPKGSTPVGTKNTSVQLNSKPCWIQSQRRWAPRLIRDRLCRGAERAQVAVREQPGFQGDGNNVWRAERGQNFPHKVARFGAWRETWQSFPGGLIFFFFPKSLNLPSFV